MARKEKDNKETLTGLARELGRLTADKKRAALEISTALAGVSLRVSRQFVESAPDAAKVLSADGLRQWGELGKRIAMGNAELGVRFFADGVNELAAVPDGARADVFEICARQLVLSSSVALETYRSFPHIAMQVGDDDLLALILKLAIEIANRSAKHSSEFLGHAPPVAKALAGFGEQKAEVTDAVLSLTSLFANKTGGMTAELWAGLPKAIEKLNARNAVTLFNTASEFLELGGSVTLNLVSSGSDVLEGAEEAFDDWCLVIRSIAAYGNAVLISFLRATPKFMISFKGRKNGAAAGDISRVLKLIARIAQTDAESALAAFKSSSGALRQNSIDQFEEWVTSGIRDRKDDSAKARRSYFALETRTSNDRLTETRSGLPLEGVRSVLRMYVEALTGKEVDVAPLSAMPQESRIGDGKTIYLPGSVAEFDDDEKNFRLYKVLAAHGAGQIEFGTFQRDTPQLKAAFTELSELYSASANDIDAFSLGGYIEDVQKAERALSEAEIKADMRGRRKELPKGSDYSAVLAVFPEPRLARKIFGTMENYRIDSQLRHTYRGLRRDLDLMRSFLAGNRPYIFDLPLHQVPSELLFQITLCGGATDDARQFYDQIVSEIETVLESYLTMDDATIGDSLMATSRVYTLFQNISAEQQQQAETDETEESGKFAYDNKEAAEGVVEAETRREPKRTDDVRELFNAWNAPDDEGEPDDLQGGEAWSNNEMPEQQLEADDIAFAYDEWDRELNDYRVGWSRVIEKKVKQGDRTFVEIARSRYRGVISSIRHQFQLMKPENLTRINREIDGEDYDLNALVDLVIDRRADGRQSENIYTKRLRKQRDVAVSILLDQSSSTARTITRNPLQPYTHPGRRIIEIEKEGLVLMSEALEAVGDVYSINGFTSEGRRNVKFYVVKDFDEKYSEEVERRIGGITFQNNTRLGAAVRHASAKLLKQEARTKLLIILTDGRPYDHDYGDARYAREDVREALTEAKTMGVTPFCITIDRESESELRDLYGDVGYTIIDDVLSLPERMPNIYRRLTS